MFLRERIDVEMALKKLDQVLRYPDLDKEQRHWLEGMLKFAEWYLDLNSPTVKRIDNARVALALQYYSMRECTDYRRIYGGQLAFAAYLRFDNNNPADTPSGKIMQMLMEGHQLKSRVPLVGAGS